MLQWCFTKIQQKKIILTMTYNVFNVKIKFDLSDNINNIKMSQNHKK